MASSSLSDGTHFGAIPRAVLPFPLAPWPWRCKMPSEVAEVVAVAAGVGAVVRTEFIELIDVIVFLLLLPSSQPDRTSNLRYMFVWFEETSIFSILIYPNLEV